MKTKNEKMLQDIQKIHAIYQNYNLSDQKEVDAVYRRLKKQGKNRFHTWIGKSFFQELKTKTSSARYRRYALFGIRQLEIFAFLTAILLLGAGAASRIKDYENKVLQEVLGEMKTQKSSDSLPDAIPQEGTETDFTQTGSKNSKNPQILEEYQKFYTLNKDFVGWIKIEGTDIDYPVLQNKEHPETYLSHNFFGKEDRSGAIFLDSAASIFPKDKNIVLYGHNMSDGSMFGQLKNFKDKTFYEEHPFFEFDTIYEKSTYRAAAVFITDISENQEFFYYNFCNYDEQEFQKYVDFIEKNKLYDTGCELAYGESFVMLSTCNGHATDSRLVIVGVEK